MLVRRLLRLLERGGGLLRELGRVELRVRLQREEGGELGDRLVGRAEVRVRDAAVEGERRRQLGSNGFVAGLRGLRLERVERLQRIGPGALLHLFLGAREELGNGFRDGERGEEQQSEDRSDASHGDSSREIGESRSAHYPPASSPRNHERGKSMENVEIAKALPPRVETATRPCDAAAENRRRTGERVSRPADDHGQIPALTGVRALAAWLVFFHHHRTSLLEVGPLVLWWELHIGVALFFVLSGFVITWRYDRRVSAGKRESFLKGYFVNRFARIYPLYFVLVVPVMLSYGVRSPSAWLLNLTLFTKYGAGIPQAWSLRVEECFYLLAPSIFLLWRRNPLLPLAAGAAILAVLYPITALPAMVRILGPAQNTLLYSFFGRFFEFYAGIWLAKRVARAGATPPTGRRFPLWTVAGIAGIAAVVVGLSALKSAVGPAYMYGVFHPAGVAV